MNGFLVVVRCGMDDIPVRLCGTYEEAEIAASALTREEVDRLQSTVLGTDASVFFRVDVMRFTDGVLDACEAVHNFEDEPSCEFA